jgi:ADP-ribosyl-[dinitrogen reductase] hydrolase
VKQAKTSLSHPLEIAELSTGPGLGKIGITFAPGKHDPSAQSGSWNRDLATDLDAIAEWGASVVLTLLEEHEMALLRIPNLGAEVRRHNMEWLHLPISDVSAPTAVFDRAWPIRSERLRKMLRDGTNIVIHCRGGIGRAGMVAARLLVELGDAPDVAIARVRAARHPRAVETAEQERWVASGPRTTPHYPCASADTREPRADDRSEL